MPNRLLRPLFNPLLAMAVSISLASLGNWLAGDVLGPVLLAALATAGGLLVLQLSQKRNDTSEAQLANILSKKLDHIMIGSAETSYFVDSVKKKIDQDVQTTRDIAVSSKQNA